MHHPRLYRCSFRPSQAVYQTTDAVPIIGTHLCRSRRPYVRQSFTGRGGVEVSHCRYRGKTNHRKGERRYSFSFWGPAYLKRVGGVHLVLLGIPHPHCLPRPLACVCCAAFHPFACCCCSSIHLVLSVIQDPFQEFIFPNLGRRKSGRGRRRRRRSPTYRRRSGPDLRWRPHRGRGIDGRDRCSMRGSGKEAPDGSPPVVIFTSLVNGTLRS
jgi:hypothetical protein